jgi:hypothetical protein
LLAIGATHSWRGQASGGAESDGRRRASSFVLALAPGDVRPVQVPVSDPEGESSCAVVGGQAAEAVPEVDRAARAPGDIETNLAEKEQVANKGGVKSRSATVGLLSDCAHCS